MGGQVVIILSPLDIHKMTSIYKYGYSVCNNSFSRIFTKLPAFTNMGTWVAIIFPP
jgi:hypothetical protein